MLKPELNPLFPDNNIQFNICNEEFVELNDFLCEYYYAKQNLNGAINMLFKKKCSRKA